MIQSREFARVKAMILDSLTNIGHPLIRVVNGNFENRGELLLLHDHEGRDLKLDFSRDTLVNLERLWKRPVHVETQREAKRLRLTYDGREHRETTLS